MTDKEITDIFLALWLGFSSMHLLYWKISTFELLRIEKALGWKANFLSFTVQSIAIVIGLSGVLCLASLIGSYAKTENNYISLLSLIGMGTYAAQAYLFKCFKRIQASKYIVVT
ncbi:MAG: hypothetical protein M0R33_12655 [Methylomonas sp.]|jgi:uncharacterized membrane protein YuzA (DUF378 family)|uniref:hypothetical protein n=1 Tax=Methylomonas sp. TaxID=418 RepID=UPI0025FB0037|nr:hypothetical protein [Methylomonas sp.]MCK9607284.1 hypothetical protein [Methylomonas sp.]